MQAAFKGPEISIHALLAESDFAYGRINDISRLFLSTLSLRRATVQTVPSCPPVGNFYPRSPCGERLGIPNQVGTWEVISIHALLAESDLTEINKMATGQISIHALLAECDNCYIIFAQSITNISIHALLAESDFGRAFWPGLSL